MDDETLMRLVISVTVAAFVAFVVHLMLGEDDGKNKKRKK